MKPTYKSAKATSLCLFLLSSPPRPPAPTPPRGLREVLAIWMLLLYCERSLIACVLPTASQTSQHGALAACLISHYLDVIHCKKKKKKERGRKKGQHQE